MKKSKDKITLSAFCDFAPIPDKSRDKFSLTRKNIKCDTFNNNLAEPLPANDLRHFFAEEKVS